MMVSTPAAWSDAFLYHLYPLGVCGAPWTNPGGDPVPRIRQLAPWSAPARAIGANTLLLGPLWESGTHGYDTHDYSTLDGRLGTNADLAEVIRTWKDQGLKVMFDGVFHHCGRGFGPFVDLVERGRDSRYRDWFSGVNFDQASPYGDPFGYEGWNGHHSLVKFNLANPEVRDHLLGAVRGWIEDYDLDGLRLDAADVMDRDFQRHLAEFCRSVKPGFWLLGEVIHGDYNLWSPGAGLDAVTNYEVYKGLWSSHNDANYFEIAWSLNRQYGPEGLYRGQSHSVFGDNHDVDRLASTLTKPAHLYPHAILSATIPGVPTVYYGSEAGLTGRKTPTGDEPLRPALVPEDLARLEHQDLRHTWARLAALRSDEPALRTGSYTQALVTHRQLAFWRTDEATGRRVLVIVNAASEFAEVTLPLEGSWVDRLSGEPFGAGGPTGTIRVPPCWGRILVPAQGG